MLTIILFITLAILVSAYIALPLRQAGAGVQQRWQQAGNHRALELEERKKSIYGAIKEIEFDYQMGKLSKDDFHELRQQYKTDAINVLRQIDKSQKKGVARGKQHRKNNPKSKRTEARFCWACGSTLNRNDNFCPDCGNKIREATN